MTKQPQLVTFQLTFLTPKAWLVVTSNDHQPLVVEMVMEHSKSFCATVSLVPGEYRCRFYCGDERCVVYHGPAKIKGSDDAGMDSVVSVEIKREPMAPQAFTILLVEDDADTLAAYARFLRFDGHTVHTADGYQTALEVAQKERVDLAVCDIGLWDGDGCDLLKDLKKRHTLKAIAVTGFTLADEVAEYRRAGFDAVLPKPVNHLQLTSTISHLSLTRRTDRLAGDVQQARSTEKKYDGM